MKRSIIIFTSITILTACLTGKKTQYELPEAMLPPVKEEYKKRCDKGLALYRINCGRCHSTKKHGREIIPDFKPEALTGYALRISNVQHETNMPDTLVTEEEIGIIMTFLTYKKKNVRN
jgi:hypothetical protein